MSRVPQQAYQHRIDGIVVEIQVHKRFSRAISWGESSRGFAWYL
jgi:hypothetical protein